MRNFFYNKQKRLNTCGIAFIILFIAETNAQDNNDTYLLSPELMSWTISTFEPWPPGKYKSANEAMIVNRIYPIFLFRGGLFPKIESTYSRDLLHLFDAPPITPVYFHRSKTSSVMFNHYQFLKALNERVYKNMLSNPKNFKYTIWQLPATVFKSESIDKPKDQFKIEVKKTVEHPEKVNPEIKFIPNRRYWTSTFAADIKFSQNKSSANWFKGEINNMNIFTNTNTSYNYSRNKIALTNTLITNFTINNSPNDTLRKYTIGTDEFRFRSNFQLKAIKNWNYSSSSEFITSMGNKYITNKQIKNSAFLSPFTINAGIGMTYALKPQFKKPNRSLDLSLSLEPLSFKYMYSKDRHINLGAYFPKDEEGNYEHMLKTFGSTITMTQTTKFNKNVTLFTRFNYFTNYEQIKGEMENKLDIILSRYFSTTLYIYLRYDDGVKKAEGSNSYLQINELFSFGFSYRW